MRPVLLGVLLAMVVAPTAHATELIGAGPATTALYNQWIAESQLPAPDVTVRIQDRSCTEWGSNACLKRTHQPMQLVMADETWLFTSDDAYPEPMLSQQRLAYRLEFLHELGHAADFASRTDRYRLVFGRIMNYPDWQLGGNAWWGARTNAVPLEQFAMAYAYCAHDRYRLDPAVFDAFSGYSYRPTRRQHQRVCRLIAKWL